MIIELRNCSVLLLMQKRGCRKLNSREEWESLIYTFMMKKHNQLTSRRRCLSCSWRWPVGSGIVCCWVKGRSRQDVLVATLVAQLASIKVARHPCEAQHPDLHRIRCSCHCSVLICQSGFDFGATKGIFAESVLHDSLAEKTRPAMPNSKVSRDFPMLISDTQAGCDSPFPAGLPLYPETADGQSGTTLGNPATLQYLKGNIEMHVCAPWGLIQG